MPAPRSVKDRPLAPSRPIADRQLSARAVGKLSIRQRPDLALQASYADPDRSGRPPQGAADRQRPSRTPSARTRLADRFAAVDPADYVGRASRRAAFSRSMAGRDKPSTSMSSSALTKVLMPKSGAIGKSVGRTRGLRGSWGWRGLRPPSSRRSSEAPQEILYCPPSTGIACPVMNEASSLERKQIAPAMSLGSAKRLIACCCQV